MSRPYVVLFVGCRDVQQVEGWRSSVGAKEHLVGSYARPNGEDLSRVTMKTIRGATLSNPERRSEELWLVIREPGYSWRNGEEFSRVTTVMIRGIVAGDPWKRGEELTQASIETKRRAVLGNHMVDQATLVAWMSTECDGDGKYSIRPHNRHLYKGWLGNGER